jgi:hypothetical protein
MNLEDTKIWIDGLQLVLSAPQIVGPIFGLVAFSAWCFRGVIEKSSQKGLRAQTSALEERLQLAHDKELGMRDKLEMAEAQLESLRSQLPNKETTELTTAASAAISTISEVLLISTELSKLLALAEQRTGS